MKVTRKMLAQYLGIHVNNCKPYYEEYLLLSGSERDYLTVADVARVDSVEMRMVALEMGLKLGIEI